MYIPKYFRITDDKEIGDFIRNNPFGTIVTVQQGKPLATHLPFQYHKEDNEVYITGHLAKANPQWKTFGDEPVLIIFQGPDAYISSSWYESESENVPTWNYQAVHVYGKIQIMDEKELKEEVKSLIQTHENGRENAMSWKDLTADDKKQMGGIVGFKVKADEVQAAYKVSQNQSDEDYDRVIEQLYKEKDVNSHQVADIMKARKEK